MKTNWLVEYDRAVTALGGERPRLLLHSCCGPCSSSVLETLLPHFDVTVFFYNPNIMPEEEFQKRLYWQREVISRMGYGVELIAPEYDPAPFYAASRGLEREPENGARCTECFRLRLTETAKAAAAGGFDWFCTTLTVSPHKDPERINAIGLVLAEEYGLRWLPSDFKKREGYKRSTVLCREHEIYRQAYCGCLWPREEEK